MLQSRITSSLFASSRGLVPPGLKRHLGRSPVTRNAPGGSRRSDVAVRGKVWPICYLVWLHAHTLNARAWLHTQAEKINGEQLEVAIATRDTNLIVDFYAT
jgi:hypothetical protein